MAVRLFSKLIEAFMMMSLLLLAGLSTIYAAAAPSPVDGKCRKGEAPSVLSVHNMTRVQADEFCVGNYHCAGYSIHVPFATCPANSSTAVWEVRFTDAWAIRRLNGNANWSTWAVPGARPPPPSPPIPPNPCGSNVTNQPRFHLTNLGTGPHDLNSIFFYKGMWHIMHQANWTDWAHVVSPDLARWTRLPSALGNNGDWDGALTFLDGKPVIMYDCFDVADCRPAPPPPPPPLPSSLPSSLPPIQHEDEHAQEERDVDVDVDVEHARHVARFESQGGRLYRRGSGTRNSSNNGVGTSSGDPAIVGVARPADYNDQNLTKWIKDPNNPIVITGRHAAYAGPSTIWMDEAKGTYNMLMSGGAPGMARYETKDPTLHTWSTADESFYPTTSGPSEFFPLPRAVSQSRGGGGGGVQYTHVLSGIVAPAPYRGGTPWYTLGVYDNATQRFTNTTKPRPLDYSDVVIFAQLHVDNGRMLFVGWFNVGASTLTAPREVVYDAEMEALRVLPVDELKALRGVQLGKHASPVTLAAGTGVLQVFDTSAQPTTSFDLEVEIALPSTSEGISFGAAILASDRHTAEVYITVSVGPVGVEGVRVVNMSAGVPSNSRDAATYNSTQTFAVPGSKSSIALRVLADRTIVEAFVSDGLGGGSTPVLAPGVDLKKTGAFIFADAQSAVTVNTANAWSMGCGWAQYP